MPNRIRSAMARAAAESYAPTPNGSAVTYGLIAAALVLAAAFIAGAFFSVDVLSHLWLLIGMTIVTFLAGVILRLWRQREHVQAFQVEYANRGPGKLAQGSDRASPQSDPIAISRAGTPQASETTTFKFPVPSARPPQAARGRSVRTIKER